MWQHTLAQSLIRTLTFAIGYLIVVPSMGCLRAWIAKQFGDEGPEQEGFLTLNPLVHIDPIGFLAILLFNFGWGKHVFFNPQHLGGPHRWLKFAGALFVAVWGYILFAVAAFLLYVLFCGTALHVGSAAPTELSIVLLSIVCAIIFTSAFLAVMDFFIDLLMAFLVYATEQSAYITPYVYYLFLFAPLIFLFLFGEQLTNLLIQSMDYVAQFFLNLLHIR